MFVLRHRPHSENWRITVIAMRVGEVKREKHWYVSTVEYAKNMITTSVAANYDQCAKRRRRKKEKK